MYFNVGNMEKNNKVLVYISIIAIGIMINNSAFGQQQKQNKENPFVGLWKSKIGSMIKIDGKQGVLISTPSEPWKKYINKITIKNIRQKYNKWIADEWIIAKEDNMWIEAEWKIVDNKITRDMRVKGEKLETFFVKTSKDFSSISSGAKVYYNRGIDYRLKGQYEQAISNLNKALEINSRYAVAFYNRGLVFQDKGQYNLAISDFRKAIEINPKDPAAYCSRGIIYFIKNEYDKAWNDFKRAQTLGGQIHPEFLKDLREASGRDK